jgi:integrase
MAVRSVERRGERRLFIDIRYRNPDGTRARYRKDAEVQTLQAARAEERRILLSLTKTGSPFGVLASNGEILGVKQDGEDSEAAAAPLFTDVAKEFLSAFAMSQLKPSTRFGYESSLRSCLIPAFGHLPIDQITPAQVRELDAELVERGVTTETRRNHQVVLRSVLRRFAVERGYFKEPPPLPPLHKQRRRIAQVLSPDDVKALLEHTPSPALRRAFAIAAFAGLRAGEIRALRWKDVDLKGRTITVRLSRCRGVTSTPKSGHERMIPLNDVLLRELVEKVKPKPDALVATNHYGEPLAEYTLRNAFRASCKRAGLEGWRFHDLRHFFVTSLFRSGAPAPAVQRLAGHSELSTTQRYSHATPADLRSAMDRMGVDMAEQVLGKRAS